MLRVDLDAPRKQRHTSKGIFDRLMAEHDPVGVTYWMVRTYVAARRPQIRVEAGRGPAKAFVPQSHQPAAAEVRVDFASDLRLRWAGGVPGRARVCLPGRGGIPAGKIRYDNLKSAVANVLGFSVPVPEVNSLAGLSAQVDGTGRRHRHPRRAVRQRRAGRR
jgi:hypothetical protein